MKFFSITVLNWNRLEYSKKTIDCLIKKTKIPHILVLVDNNSSKESGVREYLSSINESNTNATKVIHVFNNKNLGVAGGRNSGINALEKSGLEIEYYMTIDDDVIVPDNYDNLIIQALDKVPKLGITGINVEPVNYPIKIINGARVRPKNGNLGGACLAFKKNILKSIGFYRVFGSTYGLEDSDYYVRLKVAGLISAYIEPRGIHLDTDKDLVYRKVKTRIQTKGSKVIQLFAKAKLEYEKTKNVYVPYIEFDPDDPKWAEYERLDGTLQQKADIYDVFNKYNETKNIKMGNKLELVQKEEINIKESLTSIVKYFYLDTGASFIKISEELFKKIKIDLENNNIKYEFKNV